MTTKINDKKILKMKNVMNNGLTEYFGKNKFEIEFVKKHKNKKTKTDPLCHMYNELFFIMHGTNEKQFPFF